MHRRSDRAGRARARGGCADPTVRGSSSTTARTPTPGLDVPGLRRHRGVPHRPPRVAAARGRSGAGDRPVHRHRRLDERARHSSATVPGGPLLDEHNRTVRAELARWRGIEIKTIGDGFLATFDGPARAVSCAAAIVDARRPTWTWRSARACTRASASGVGDDVARDRRAHRGARDGARPSPGEVLASSTVKDLVVGSGLRFVGPRRARAARRARRVAAVRARALSPGSKRSRRCAGAELARHRARDPGIGVRQFLGVGSASGSRTRAAAPRCRARARSRRRSTCPARTGAA